MLSNVEKLQLVTIAKSNGDVRETAEILAQIEADAAMIAPRVKSGSVVGEVCLHLPSGEVLHERVKADGTREQVK